MNLVTGERVGNLIPFQSRPSRDFTEVMARPRVGALLYETERIHFGTYKHVYETAGIVAVTTLMAGEKRELRLLTIEAAFAHDFGKTGIERTHPGLLDEGRLSPEQFETIKEHPEIGFRKLWGTGEFSDVVCYAVLNHHRDRQDPDKCYPGGKVNYNKHGDRHLPVGAADRSTLRRIIWYMSAADMYGSTWIEGGRGYLGGDELTFEELTKRQRLLWGEVDDDYAGPKDISDLTKLVIVAIKDPEGRMGIKVPMPERFLAPRAKRPMPIITLHS